MSRDDPRVDTIFTSAIEIASGEERTAFVARACGTDEELRCRVERLIAAHFQAGSFLEVAPAAPTVAMSSVSSAEVIGAVIGPYRLLQQIGEGGMGTVFMAAQERPVRRKVALKVVKPGMDSRQVIARFEAERQALALMDHRNIARVLDAGALESGRPYFVMELVHGVPITSYCDDNRLSPRQRMELFVPVCRAIQHAHQKGIIHRDIKPSNVLVTHYDGKPEPKVIDFGVAKATGQDLTDRTLFTQYGALVGTLEYMSPEQAEMSALGVDTRSDIYSLGVLLYELLTGSTPLMPYRNKSSYYSDLLRMIKEHEPAKPSTRLSDSGESLASISARRSTEPARLMKLVRGELDWIVMKALDKDRNRRYETATDLAADLQRYLNDQPVQAGPPSAFYRFSKFARRNQAVLITVVIVTSALLLGTALSIWQAVRATRAMATAVVQKQRADEQAALATSISESLQQLVGSLNPDAAKGPDYTARQLLDEFANNLEEKLSGQPRAATDLHAILGRAYACVGQGDKARKHLARALTLCRGAFGDRHEKYADILVDYARPDASDHSERPERDADLRRALSIYRERGVEGERVIRAFWTLHWSLTEQVHAGRIRWDRADAVLDEALAEAAKSPGVVFPKLASLYRGLAGVMIRRHQYAEAERIAREAVAMHLRLDGPENLETAWGYFVHAEPLRLQNKFAEALVAYRHALDLMRKALPPGHRNIAIAATAVVQTLELADSSHALIDLFSSAAEVDELASVLRRVLEQTQPSSLGYDDPAIAAVKGLAQFSVFYVDLGHELAAAGKSKEAEKCRRNASLLLEGFPAQLAGKPKLLPYAYGYGAIAWTKAGEPGRANELGRKLLEMNTKTGDWFNQVAWSLANAEDPVDRDPGLAVELATKAVEANPEADTHRNTLGVARYRAGDWAKAIPDLEMSVALAKGGSSYDWFFLAMAHRRLGHEDQARRWYDRAVAWMDEHQPTDEELRRIRAEAEVLMQIKGDKPNKRPESK